MLQRTKQTLCEIWSTFLALSLLVIWQLFPASVVAQSALNLDQFRREHLLTHGVGDDTGNLGIYVSFPNWFGKAGYCPIEVRVVPRKGVQFKENGELKIVIGTGYGFSVFEDSNRQVIVSVPIEAGKTEAKKEVLGNFLLGENGRFDMLHMKANLNGRNLRSQQVYIYNARAGTNECRYLSLISKESSEGDSRRQDALKEMEETGRWYSQESNVTAVGYSVSFCNVRSMPPNWLYLSPLEAISISLEDLARMNQSGLDQLNQYVLAGGYLSVNRVSSLQQVVKYLPIDPLAKLDKARGTAQSNFGNNDTFNGLIEYEPPSLDFIEETIWDDYRRLLGKNMFSLRQTYSMSGGAAVKFPPDFYTCIDWICNDIWSVCRTAMDAELAQTIRLASYYYDTLSKTKPTASVATATEEVKFPVLYAHGFGRVYLTDKRRSETQSFTDGDLGLMASMVQNSATPQTLLTTSNNRTTRLAGGIGDGFWDWLIPSVGKTPAIPFLIFVVLFVGVGAPGIMYWSNKHRRRVWLVVLMPILATMCTLVLFTYGVLKDGFGAVSRTRSLAFVDDKGKGIVWSRQTYFAASVSNQGVVVGPDIHFAPMPVNTYSTLPLTQHIPEADAQQYVGVLPPRLQTQFSLTHPLRDLKLVKRLSEIDPTLKAPAIQNDSEFTWTKAVFVGPNEDYYVASSVAPGSRCEFKLVDRDEATDILQKAYKSQPLAAPSDSPSADQTTLAKTFGNLFSIRPSIATSFGHISEESTWTQYLGRIPSDFRTLRDGSFMIFTNEAPYVEKCMANTRELDGLHMIVGRW